MNIYVEKIIQIANEKKIPLSKICTDTNINKNSFNKWKNGVEPPLDKIINIIKYLDLSADEIFENDVKDNLQNEETLTVEEMCSLALIIGNVDLFLIGHLVCADLAENISCDMQRVFNKCIRNLVRRNLISDKCNNEDVEKMKRITNRFCSTITIDELKK